MTCFFFLGIYRILSLTFQNIALWCLSDDELFWVPSGAGGGLVAKLCPTLHNPVDYSLPGSSVRGILLERILEWVAMPSSRDLPNPGIETRSPALQADSLPSEPPGKPCK